MFKLKFKQKIKPNFLLCLTLRRKRSLKASQPRYFSKIQSICPTAQNSFTSSKHTLKYTNYGPQLILSKIK